MAAQTLSRTVTWAPPAENVWTGRPLDAVDHLLGIRSRRVAKPPLYELLHVSVVDARTGNVTYPSVRTKVLPARLVRSAAVFQRNCESDASLNKCASSLMSCLQRR